jgi:hypothetical protein
MFSISMKKQLVTRKEEGEGTFFWRSTRATVVARDRCIGGRGGIIDNVSLSSFK